MLCKFKYRRASSKLSSHIKMNEFTLIILELTSSHIFFSVELDLGGGTLELLVCGLTLLLMISCGHHSLS